MYFVELDDGHDKGSWIFETLEQAETFVRTKLKSRQKYYTISEFEIEN